MRTGLIGFMLGAVLAASRAVEDNIDCGSAGVTFTSLYHRNDTALPSGPGAQ